MIVMLKQQRFYFNAELSPAYFWRVFGINSLIQNIYDEIEVYSDEIPS